MAAAKRTTSPPPTQAKKRSANPWIVFFAALAVIFPLLIAAAVILFPRSDSPIVDPEKKRLVDAARTEFEVPSDYELSQLAAEPERIPDEDLAAVDPISVRVAICPQTERACDPESDSARLFYLDHVVQYGVADHPDIYDFVFRRHDRDSLSADRQEVRYRTWDGGGVAALVIPPTDWYSELRRNQIARLPTFEQTSLGEFLYANHANPDVLAWGNVSDVAKTCIGHCPEPTPGLSDRLADRIDPVVAYLETDEGRNLTIAVCAIISALAALLTFLLKGVEFAIARRRKSRGAEASGVRRGNGAAPPRNPKTTSRSQTPS